MTDFPIKKFLSSESNLEMVLDNLSEGILAHDLKRRIFVFNREAERITGFDRKYIIGRDCHEVFGAPLCGEQCSFCGDAPVPDRNKQYTINFSSRSGETKNIEMSVTPMRDENNEIFGVIASLKDVTEIFDLKIKAEELHSFNNIIGHTPHMLQVFQQIRDVAHYNFPVHVTGETGTGKELVSAAIHQESERKGAPFVPINCGALPEGLIESELFGHVKGSFSGAVRDKKGRFELAEGGTVFLDEVAELSKYMQVKLLRFLQEGTFERVGGEKTISANVRIVSATNKNLKKEVEKGNFREDLFFRLNVIPIALPALRDRKNDIPLLVEHFLKQTARHYGSAQAEISNDALSIMLDYRWPGNVRELQNAVQYAIVKSRGSVIKPKHLPMELAEGPDLRSGRKGSSRKLDFEVVRSALKTSGGNKVKAAKLLGVGRATLYRFIKDFPDVLDT